MINDNKTVYNQYSGIDLVRFICSILVVTIHVPPFGVGSPIINGYINGYIARLAVPFFFIASSFFLYSKCLKNPVSEIYIIKRYLQRIFNLYLIWSIIYLPISLVQIYKANEGFSVLVILDFLRQTLLVGSFVHLWYLVALIVSIILFSSLLCVFKRKVHVVYVICIILYSIGLLGQGYGFDISTHTHTQVLTYITSLYDKIFETTRNGLFEAPIFIAIGYYFAGNTTPFKLRPMVLFFVLLLIALFFEVSSVTNALEKTYDYFILLVPTCFCLFWVSKTIKLSCKNKISVLMRKMSSVIFFIHYWIAFGINNLLKLIHIDVTSTFVWFLLTIMVTLLCSYFIIKLSNYNKFRLFSQLY